MTIILFAVLLGIIAGLRSMTSLAVVSWAVNLGLHNLNGTWFAFFGNFWVCAIFTFLALVELLLDQLPTTPNRTVPPAFITRILSGAFCGAVIATAEGGMVVAGISAGVIGSVIGTLGGLAFRSRLATTIGKDRPAAFIEDAIAIGGALLIGIALL